VLAECGRGLLNAARRFLEVNGHAEEPHGTNRRMVDDRIHVDGLDLRMNEELLIRPHDAARNLLVHE